MKCSICRNPKGAEIVEDYCRSLSLRKTAERYNVGFRSLQRHIDKCLEAILSEEEEQEYQNALRLVEPFLKNWLIPKPKKLLLRSKITKNVEFTWSRKSWEKPK
jgi:hypothetical protein